MTTWEADRERLLRAVERAEGGPDALLRAVRCSVPSCKDVAEARDITRRSLYHMLWDYAMADPSLFVRAWGRRWAPVGAANDPTGLNQHWPGNVLSIYQGPLDKSTGV